MSEDNIVCGICGLGIACVFCYCKRTESFYCYSCQSRYADKGHGQSHIFLPILAYGEHTNPGYLARLSARMAKWEQAESAIRRNIADIDICIGTISTETQRVIDAVWCSGNAMIQDLKNLKAEMEAEIEAAIKEAREKIYEDEPFFESSWAQKMREFEQESQPLQLFTYQCDSRELLEKVKDICTFRQEKATYSTLLLPAFLSTRLLLHDVIHSTSTEFLLPIKVSDGARLCLIDNFNLLVVGGYPASPDAKLIHIQTGGITILQQMSNPRWAAGLIKYDNFAYVFGGMGQKSCEQLSFDSRRWRTLHEMAETRSYFTPCEYSGDIYLPASQLPIEVFTPSTESFSTLPIVLSELSGASVSLIIYGELTVITSDYQIARWRMGDNKAKIDQFPAKGDPPSSQCPPVRYQRELFFVFWKTGMVNAFNVNNLGLKRKEIVS